MAVIIPALLPTSAKDLEEKLLALQGIAEEVQVDIVDGIFAGPATWPYLGHEDKAGAARAVAEAGSFMGALRMEMDLMVAHPEEDIARWIEAGANRITVHAASAHQLPRFIEDFRTRYGHDASFAPGLLSFGLAIHFSADLSLIEPYVSECDYVQFMGIAQIGKQGEPFERRVLSKIEAFKKKFPNTPVQVDGGVSLATAPALLEAGVSRLIIGSALWKAPDLAAAHAAFIELTMRYGLYE